MAASSGLTPDPLALSEEEQRLSAVLVDSGLIRDVKSFEQGVTAISDQSSVLAVIKSIPTLLARVIMEVGASVVKLGQGLTEVRQEIVNASSQFSSQVSAKIAEMDTQSATLNQQVNDNITRVTGTLTAAQGEFAQLSAQVGNLEQQASGKIVEMTAAIQSLQANQQAGTAPGLMSGNMDSVIRGFEHRLQSLESAGVDVRITQMKQWVEQEIQSKGTGGKGKGRGSMLERKSIQFMKVLGSDKSSFRTWHDKLVNSWKG